MRVLLTEDEPILADLIVEFLEDEGHQVVRVSDQRRAADLACTTTWDAWVIDPCGNCFTDVRPECAAEFRRVGSHVPIVVTTGRAWARRTSAADLGVRAILNKPYDFSELQQTLESINTPQ